MKLLVIPSWYPSTTTSYKGIFIREQVEALMEAQLEAAILYGDYHYRHLFKQNKSSFQLEANIPTFRTRGFFVPKLNHYLIEQWAKMHFPLLEDYINRYDRPDLIHAHSYMAGAIAFQIKQHYGIPYVLTEHLFRFLTGDVRQRHQALVREVYDGASALIAVSGALKKAMQDYTTSSIEQIPNLVDTQYFKPLAFRQNTEKTFITVGSLNRIKAFDLLINAFKAFKLKAKDHSILKIIGDGPLKSELQAQIKQLGLTKEVFLLGTLDRAKILEELQHAHCFVSSSQVETFGVAIIEALAVGLPVIATRCGGPEEIVSNESGRLVAKNDQAALTQALLELDLGKYDANKIRASVEHKYSKKLVVEKLISFYHDIITKNKE